MKYIFMNFVFNPQYSCWLTTERSFIWSFVGPALAVMMVRKNISIPKFHFKKQISILEIKT